MTGEGASALPSEWLARHGWFPGRDIGAQAEELIEFRVQDSVRQGHPLTLFQRAATFIHSYGLLKLPHPKAEGSALHLDPKGRYEGDAEEIAELSEGLGTLLFPVGFEEADLSLLLVDDKERFFFLHHTGAYYAGEGASQMFDWFINNVDLPDAEDLFVS
ncbi:SUKH-3 domain-containing protein [Streptomyces longwoodensis]|uniref:SUKH-3 domain-containing protein n=1 Tax=Streptomyces longwoodensis TaxID=68231 RepID=UPI0033FEEEFA